ncbi:MAG: hypothetical protein SGI73_18440, partial [Chloroflexota bacterium]|nr:hypothetical protein [Chloroflexota bacterium]
MIAARAPRTAWRQLALISAFTLIVTALPYLIGATRTDAAWQFSGFVFGVEDGNSYLGKMRLGMRGQFAFHLFYTPEIHAAAPLINLPYIAVGWIAGLFVPESDPRSHAALTAAFHAFRLVADALLIVAVYRFGARFIAAPRARRIALLLALFGGGIGWLLALIGQSNLFGSLPADLYIPEGFSFQVLFGLPHLALARAALLTGFVLLTPPPDPLSTAFT